MFQEQHYQSLARADLVVKVDPEEKARPDSGFEEEEEEEEEELRSDEGNLRRQEEDLMVKVIMGPNPNFSDNTRFTLEYEGEGNGNEMVQTYLKRSKG